MISATDYLLMGAILLNENQSYGKEIFESAEKLAKETKSSIAYGSMYPALERLENEGLLKSEMGEPQKIRGGKARRLYSVTGSGVRAVRNFESMAFHIGARLQEVIL